MPKFQLLKLGLAASLLGLSACAPLTTLDWPSSPEPSRTPVASSGVRSAEKASVSTAKPSGQPAPSVLIKAPTPQYDDLLDRLRSGLQLVESERIAIDREYQWYARNPEYLDRVFGRAALYMFHIVEEVERRGMPMEIALLPVIESAFEPFAYSSARASGLWQFIPGTGSRFGLPQNWWYDGRRDVMASTRAALDYLQFMHDQFEGDWLLAMAGYNCGENCVARAVARNRAEGKGTTFWDLRLPNETRAYVPKILAMARVVADPARISIEFSPIPNEAYFTRVDIEHQIDLKLAAELAGLTYDELFELNPAYHRWATPPDGPHSLLLPLDSAELFKQNVANLSADELMRVTHHTVAANETLGELAARYSTTVTTLRMLNGLGSTTLAPGTDLRVPTASTQLPVKVLRAAARVDGPEPRPRSNRPEIHVVRRGESIWSIAQRNNMDHRALLRLNGKKPTDKLMPGERLVLSATSLGTPNETGAVRSAASGASLTHRVSSGETLYSIARRYGVTVAQLANWNDLSLDRVLHVGQRLTIRSARR